MGKSGEEPTEEGIDEYFTRCVKDDAEENGALTGFVVEREANTRNHESGAENEDPTINEGSDEDPSTWGSWKMGVGEVK